jgi:hypothetical protein
MSDQSKLIPFPQSEGTDVLTHFDRARQELELAATIDEVKKIRDKAEALRQYAKQSRLSLDMQNRCAEIRIRAERRAGDMLKEMEKHPPGPIPVKDRLHDATNLPPRLDDLGISKSQSSRWQAIASIPEEDFEERVESLKVSGRELTSSEMLSLAGFLRREQERRDRREGAFQEAQNIEPDDRIRIIQGDFRDVLADVPDGSVQLILTDPVYAKEQLSDWSVLSLFASRVLKPGKLLACYTSTNILAESIGRLSEHLRYVWTFAVIYPACGKPHHQYRLNGWWKPILLFSNGSYQPEARWINRDVINGDGLTKDHHEWEQGLREAEYLIENLSYENDVVVDPFVGSGTTPIACKRLNRRFLGCDEDRDAVNTALARLAQEIESEPNPRD